MASSCFMEDGPWDGIVDCDRMEAYDRRRTYFGRSSQDGEGTPVPG